MAANVFKAKHDFNCLTTTIKAPHTKLIWLIIPTLKNMFDFRHLYGFIDIKSQCETF